MQALRYLRGAGGTVIPRVAELEAGLAPGMPVSGISSHPGKLETWMRADAPISPLFR
jgi:hypothetical protein